MDTKKRKPSKDYVAAKCIKFQTAYLEMLIAVNAYTDDVCKWHKIIAPHMRAVNRSFSKELGKRIDAYFSTKKGKGTK